jgi:hypothetical protein
MPFADRQSSQKSGRKQRIPRQFFAEILRQIGQANGIGGERVVAQNRSGFFDHDERRCNSALRVLAGLVKEVPIEFRDTARKASPIPVAERFKSG